MRNHHVKERLPPRCCFPVAARPVAVGLLALLALAGAATAAAMEPASVSEERILSEARRQMDRGLLRAAGANLAGAISQSNPASSPGYPRLALLLGEVYFRSAHYTQAVEAAEKCQTYLDRRSSALPRAEMRAQRHDATQLLIKALIARNGPATPKLPSDRERAERIVDEALREEVKSPVSIAKVELLVLRAELFDARLRDSAAQPIDADRWNEAERSAGAVIAPLIKAGPSEILLDAMRQHCRCLAALDRSAEAVKEWRILADRLDLKSPMANECWTEIARIENRLGGAVAEAAAWQQALRFWAADAPPKDGQPGPQDPWADALRLGEQAECRCKLALALGKAQRHGAAVEQFEQCVGQYGRALELLARAPGISASDVDGQRAALLHGRLEAAENFSALEGRQQVESAENAIDDAVQLHDLLVKVLLDDDPRIQSLNVNVGARYVRAGKFAEARPFLSAAQQHYRNCQPPDPLRLARVDNLLSEVERADGSIEAAESRLNEALRLYQQERLDDLPLLLAIQLNQGRLAAAKGNYALALRQFDLLIDRKEHLPPQADELCSLALLNKGMLYKALSRLDTAEKCCREALDQRRAQLSDDDFGLLQYHIALAAVRIDAGNLDDAGASLDAVDAIFSSANRSAAKKPGGEKGRLEGTPLGVQARHLRALIHFCKYQAGGAASEAIAAATIWEQLLPFQAQRLDKAQTLHFLSRLKFLQWKREIEEGRKQWRQAAFEKYNKANADYSVQNDAFAHDRQSYLNDRDAYQKKLRDYNPRVGPLDQLNAKYRELSDWNATLERTKQDLIARRGRLERQQAELTELRQATLARYPFTTTASLATADDMASQAVELVADLPLYPNLHYAALCNRAQILRAASGDDPPRRRKAIKLLSQAIALIERPRLMAAGQDITRAEFFAHYSEAYDLLVAWLVEDQRPADALVFAELCHNRTFLDHIRSDGVSIATDLSSADQHLALDERAIEADYARTAIELDRINGKDPESLASAESRRQLALRQDLDRLYARYADARRRICLASPIYQHVFAKPLTEDEVRQVIRRRLSSGEMTLYFHMGSAGAFVFLAGPGPDDLLAVRLQSPELKSSPENGASGQDLRRSVDAYLQALQKDDFPGAPGSTRVDLVAMTDSLVPPELRDRIRQNRRPGPTHLTIIPDGNLYRLPFEALVVEASPKPRFLIDELRPMTLAYAPSLMVLDAIKTRPRVERAGAVVALSVASPDYKNTTPNSGPVARRYLAILGDDVVGLPDLRRSREESDSLVDAFGRDRVRQLLGQAATKSSFLAELVRARPTYLHLATHGIAAEDALTGEAALALSIADPRHPSPEDDGFLEVPEIYRLPLGSCELAALSACNTNVGRAAPLEMGVTISRAFLSAGARRVVASQWPVSDEATTVLMTRFFHEIAAMEKLDKPCDYAAALQKARDELRTAQGGRWASPRFWAPFVLLGPAD